MKSNGQILLGIILAVELFVFSYSSLSAPRTPQPPLPEFSRVSFSERFDAQYYAQTRVAEINLTEQGKLVESWSGYALQRVGDVPPFVIAGVQEGRTNLFPNGASRLWIKPYWSSVSTGDGKGLGREAVVSEMSVVGRSQAATVWSLRVNADGSMIYLVSDSAVVLKSEIVWRAGEWHQVVLNFSEKGTALALDGEIVAEGVGVLTVPSSVAALTVGSSLSGSESIEGELDEVYCFARPLKMGFHYTPFKDMAARGAISAEEMAYREELAEKHKAAKALKAKEEEESGGGVMMLRMAGPANDCITNGPVYLTNVVCNFNTNDGWTLMFDIAGGTNGVLYDIYSTPEFVGNDITNSVWTWLETGMTCETHYFTNQPTNQTFYILTVPGADRDGDGLYDGWEWKHFGTLAQTAGGDYDGDGELNGDTFTNETSPNVLNFSLLTPQYFVNTTTLPVSVHMNTGVAESIAVLVDEANTTLAVWQNFQTNIQVSFSGNEGWHEVHIGLSGHLADNVVWKRLRFKYDVTPPTLVITNPIVNSGAQSKIQIQGYGNEPLISVSYSLTNALGLVTNQPGFVIDQVFSPSIADFTTNVFQCFDVALTNGVNVFSVTIADLAGNTTTASFSYFLDGSGDNTAPTIGLAWPHPGAALSGDNFTAHGYLNDPCATVSAQIVANGNTNDVAGIVGRNGEFWIEGIPLSAATNSVSIVAADFWGNNNVTNLTVYKSAIIVTVDAILDEQLAGNFTTVSGTVSAPNQDLWINGVLATSSNGVWQAQNVPLKNKPKAEFQIFTVPTGGNPTNTASTASAAFYLEIPPEILITRVHQALEADEYYNIFQLVTPIPYRESTTNHLDWEEGTGGTYYARRRLENLSNGGVSDCTKTTTTLPATFQELVQGFVVADTCLGSSYETVAPYNLHAALYGSTGFNRQQTQNSLKASSEDGIETQDLVLVKVQAQGASGAIHPKEIVLQGKTMTPSATDPNVGEALVSVPRGASVNATPTITSEDQYYWSTEVKKVKLKIMKSATDLTSKTNSVVVGQGIQLGCQLDNLDLNSSLTNFQWSVAGKTIEDYYVAPVNYDSPANNQTNGYPIPLTTTTNRFLHFFWYDGGTHLEVRCRADLVINGKTHTVSAVSYFNVIRPDIEWLGLVEAGVAVDTNYSFPALHFGWGDTTTNRGMVFRASNYSSNGFTGEWRVNRFQIGSIFARYNLMTTNSGGAISAAGLDVRYPYWSTNQLPAESSDSPGIGTPTNIWKVSIQHHSICYLFFEPDFGILNTDHRPVPIRAIEWSWSGVAITNGMGGWQLLSSPSNANLLQNNFLVNEYPRWTNNIRAQTIIATNWF